MNKTQFYTLSGALLASTALSGAANAGMIGRYSDSNFTTSPLSIQNSIFSATASTANAVTIGGAGAIDRDIGMMYNNNFSGSTHWTTEFTIAGARFITGGLTTANVEILLASDGNAGSVSTSISGTSVCASVTSLVDLLVVNDCSLSAVSGDAGTTGVGTGMVHGIALTGVTFNSASGLATAGASVSLTGRVYNPNNTSQIFEASSTGNILTSALPLRIAINAGDSATASATTTPNAFVNLSAPTNGSLSVTLATVTITGTGALGATLAVASASTASHAGTTTVTVTSSILSSAAVRSVSLVATAGSSTLSYLTAANFSGGTVTFTLTNTTWAAGGSAAVIVQFMGTTSIPAAVAGTAAASINFQTTDIAQSSSGTTAAVSQGGFRAEINTFNASTNGPFSSYLRIHNNGAVAGVVTITISNDDHAVGGTLGSSFTTGSILPASTMQLSAAEMEGTTTSTKLPSGGANVPTASRTGSYTLNITGPIVGYVQHILFDGNSVADLSGYRNSGATSNNP